MKNIVPWNYLKNVDRYRPGGVIILSLMRERFSTTAHYVGINQSWAVITMLDSIGYGRCSKYARF